MSKKSVPAWIKAKGFSNWGDYMASIRPAHRKRRRLRNPSLLVPAKQTKCPVCRQLCAPGEKYHPGCKPPRHLKSVNPISHKKALRYARQLVKHEKTGVKKNPIAVYNPPRKKLPIANVEIRYQRAGGQYRGEWFKHPFRNSVDVFGLGDGSILIKSKNGVKLWGTV